MSDVVVLLLLALIPLGLGGLGWVLYLVRAAVQDWLNKPAIDKAEDIKTTLKTAMGDQHVEAMDAIHQLTESVNLAIRHNTAQDERASQQSSEIDTLRRTVWDHIQRHPGPAKDGA